MWNTLPDLTGSRARGADQLGGFGLVREALPIVTNPSIWVSLRPPVPLPIITSRGVKYTHNDINDTVLHPDSGPTRMGLVHPERHQSLEVDTHHTHDRQSILGQEPVVLRPRPRQSHDTTANTRAKLTILVKNS